MYYRVAQSRKKDSSSRSSRFPLRSRSFSLSRSSICVFLSSSFSRHVFSRLGHEDPSGDDRARPNLSAIATTRPGCQIQASHLCKRDARSRSRGPRAAAAAAAATDDDIDEDGVRHSTANVTRDSAIHPPGGLLPGVAGQGTYPLTHFNLNCEASSWRNETSIAAVISGSRAVFLGRVGIARRRSALPVNSRRSSRRRVSPHRPLFTYIDSRLFR